MHIPKEVKVVLDQLAQLRISLDSCNGNNDSIGHKNVRLVLLDSLARSETLEATCKDGWELDSFIKYGTICQQPLLELSILGVARDGTLSRSSVDCLKRCWQIQSQVISLEIEADRNTLMFNSGAGSGWPHKVLPLLMCFGVYHNFLGAFFIFNFLIFTYSTSK